MRWLVDDSVTAAWFEASRPAVRAHVLATGRYGHGPHHSESAFYVGPGDFEIIPADALAAYTRTNAARRARSVALPVGVEGRRAYLSVGLGGQYRRLRRSGQLRQGS